MNTYIIYKITCSVNNKAYVGLTKDLERRLQLHVCPSSGCRALRNAIQKYGWVAFSTAILTTTPDQEQARLLEEKYITEHNTQAPHGYNLQSGGQYHLQNEETKELLRQLRKGKPSYRKNVPLTEEHKQRISAAMKGKPSPWKGLTQTKEHITNRMANHKGYVRTEQHKLLVAQQHRGKKLLPETIEKRTATRAAKRLAKLNVSTCQVC